MTARLPDGFAVQIDPGVRRVGSGAALLGGSPVRLLRLSPKARALLDDAPEPGRLEVRDAVTAQLARSLLDATVAHPRPAGGATPGDVTVVVPVRDNEAGVRRLLAALPGMRVVVVDDGSVSPLDAARFADAPCRVQVIRHPRSRGPAVARNTGSASVTTDLVAFLDSDVVPQPGWLDGLLGHFRDPSVALVAPRIVDHGGRDTALARYEAERSCLDLGPREAPVVPYGPVSYVPSAAIVCRRTALSAVAGFDESLHCGEDVDLCWRLVEAGFRLRYEPAAAVGHEHRTRLPGWLGRRAFYGGSAAALSLRHPDKIAPLVLSGWAVPVWLLLGLGSAAALPAAALALAVSGRRTARAMRDTGAAPGEAPRLAARGLAAGGLHLAAALCRPYWPLAAIAAVVSRRARRAVTAAVAVTAAHDLITRPPRRGDRPAAPAAAYLALRRLDDLAYGTGLWNGMRRERTLRPLRPIITP